jgi:hypothetical protein
MSGFAQNDASAVISPAWRRVIIVGFERRIPEEAKHEVGPRLAALREQVVRVISKQMARQGDHIFLFADGIAPEEFGCLVRGESCKPGLRQLEWRRGPQTVKTFLAAMLKLPVVGGGHQDRVTGPAGSEFVHLIYDGNPIQIDCAIRREITAPMTDLPRMADPNCPAEGVESQRSETRSLSRVELSFPVQFSEALSTIQEKHLVAEVYWIWALLHEKQYEISEITQATARDFGRQVAPYVDDYFRKANSDYSRDAAQPIVMDGGSSLTSFQVKWKRTEDAIKQLRLTPSPVELRIGTGRMVPGAQDLNIERSIAGRSWEPKLDNLKVEASLPVANPAKLLAGAIRSTTAFESVPRVFESAAVPAVNNVVQVRDERIETVLAELMRSPTFRYRTIHMQVDLLVSGPRANPDYGMEPIPGLHYPGRDIRVRIRPPAVWEMVIYGTLLWFLAALAWKIFRPQPFDLRPSQNSLEWTLPPDGKMLREVTLTGRSDQWHRRIRPARTSVSITWQFLPALGLPIRDGSPVRLEVGGNDVVQMKNLQRTIRWAPGTRRNPKPILRLDLTLNPAAFVPERMDAPGKFRCLIKCDASVTPHGFPRLIRENHAFNIDVLINITEDLPAPKIWFEIDSQYRRLGFDGTEGSFGTLLVENLPRAKGGVARTIEFNAKIEVEKNAYGRDLVIRFLNTKSRDLNASVQNGERPTFPISLRYDGEVSVAEPLELRGAIVVHWIDTGTGVKTPERLPLTLSWLPVPTRLVGIDIGTSGTRLFIQNSDPALLYRDDQLEFPMRVINPEDSYKLPEFPSMVLIHRGQVLRAGSPQVFIAQKSGMKLGESPKAAVLSAVSREERESARADMESYIKALGVCWAAIRQENPDIKHVSVVVTIPWSFTAETSAWYCEAIKEAFAGCALVAPVREAEAAAYFHLLYEHLLAAGRRSGRPRNRRFRTLVIDLGAGTTDYAVISTSSPQGYVEKLRILTHTYSLWAGNRYDQTLLKRVFKSDDAAERLPHDRQVRDEIRLFKEHRLERMLSESDVPSYPQIGSPVHTSRAAFMKAMEPFFENAISVPLRKVYTQLDLRGEGNWIDEVLLAGRGFFAAGCQERVQKDVETLFRPNEDTAKIAIRPLAMADAPWAIARGALTFGRSGDVTVDDSDLMASCDIALLADTQGRPEMRWLQTIGEPISPRDESIDFEDDVRAAWILAGRPALAEDQAAVYLARLRTGQDPGNGVMVCATWRREQAARAIRVRVFGNERAEFGAALPGD